MYHIVAYDILLLFETLYKVRPESALVTLDLAHELFFWLEVKNIGSCITGEGGLVRMTAGSETFQALPKR